MHDAFLQQARRLARLDPSKPKQANLRRAISSVYYGLFHFLVDQACRASIGAGHDQASFRQVLGRAYERSVIKSACGSFSGGTLKANAAKGLPAGFAIPAEIRNIANTFVELQRARNLADYDLTERFQRSTVLTLIRQASNSIRDFKNVASSNEKKFFLACLLAWKSLSLR